MQILWSPRDQNCFHHNNAVMLLCLFCRVDIWTDGTGAGVVKKADFSVWIKAANQTVLVVQVQSLFLKNFLSIILKNYLDKVGEIRTFYLRSLPLNTRLFSVRYEEVGRCREHLGRAPELSRFRKAVSQVGCALLCPRNAILTYKNNEEWLFRLRYLANGFCFWIF